MEQKNTEKVTEKVYDIIVLGGGPAGLTAGLYAARSKSSVLILEKGNVGGLITSTHDVQNYPGGVNGDSGTALTQRMKEQAVDFGAELVLDEITSVEFAGAETLLKGYMGEYRGKSVIVASGALPKQLGAKGEAEHTGFGVSYCATCDGAFFQDLEVYVIGGGDSALEEAMYLTRFASKVTIVHRREEFRGAKLYQERAAANPKISFKMNTVLVEVKGEGTVDEAVFENTITGEREIIKADVKDGLMGIFIFAGYHPNSDIWKGILELDEAGYILANERMETSVPGIFAAGDIRRKELRQVVTAAADGAIAAVNAAKYVEDLSCHIK